MYLGVDCLCVKKKVLKIVVRFKRGCIFAPANRNISLLVSFIERLYWLIRGVI